MANWKITIPVERAEERADGMYIVGEASGPERDTHGTQMAPQAILDFARQISDAASNGQPLPYVDAHTKDGVLRELGAVVEGAITSNFHLKIGVRLDDANPASQYLHQQIVRGKQYGMSIRGDNAEYEITKGEGGRVLQFTKVNLLEISNTTRPSWVPSFGTVLARSVDGLDESGEPTDMTDAERAAAAEQETAPVVETTEQVTEDTTESTERTEETTETPEATSGEETEDVERARISKKDADALVASYAALGDQLKALGVIAQETPVVTPENNETVENSDAGDEMVELAGITVQRSVADAVQVFLTGEIERATAALNATLVERETYIAQLEALPAGKIPAPIVREKFENVLPDLSRMTPEERLHFGLEGLYANR
jgi:hypothetical protein